MELTFPLNQITGLDKYIINIPTHFAVNGEPFDIVFGYNTTTYVAQLLLNKHILKNWEDFGIHTMDRLDQIFADGLVHLSSKMIFCRGLTIDFNEVSKVPERHHWKEQLSDGSFKEWTSFHSQNCQYLLPFGREYNTHICHTCIKDLK